MLEAERAGAAGAFKLKAKLLWDSSRHAEAVSTLQCGADALAADGPTDGARAAPSAATKLRARAQLKLLAWRVAQGQGDVPALQEQFTTLTKAAPEDDKAHMEFAVFLRKVYEDLRARCAILHNRNKECACGSIDVYDLAHAPTTR